MSQNLQTGQQSSPLGCCLLGIIFAIFASIFYAITNIARAIWNAMPMVFRGLYYFVAWPVLAFEYGWRRGGAWRILAIILGVVFVVLYGTARYASPTVTTHAVAVTASPHATAVAPTASPATTATSVQPTASPATTATSVQPTASPVTTATSVQPTATQPDATSVQPTATQPDATSTMAPVAQSTTAPSTYSTTSASSAQAIDASWVAVSVIRVVDGDTIHVNYNGVDTTVRLIGVDTPETVDPRKPVQCFGVEASNYTKSQLNKQNIYLEFDASQGTLDKYKRLLAYVRRADGSLFNYDLIYNGYAFEYTYQNNPYNYQADFIAAARDARENGRGLWAATTCNGVAAGVQATTTTGGQTGGSQTGSTDAADAAPCQVGQIKGNRNSKIYHVPGGASYARTKANVECFDTEQAAIAAKYRKAKR